MIYIGRRELMLVVGIGTGVEERSFNPLNAVLSYSSGFKSKVCMSKAL